jgi:predicted amidohydrolase YtcJ
MISFQSIHCIGDRANQVVLDIYQGILTRSEGNVTEWRPRIEHAQIFAPNDLKRIGELGGWQLLYLIFLQVLLITYVSLVIASVQPTHA